MEKNKNKRYTFRRFINDLHLWLGVASAIILFLVCLSGTAYTFRHEIEESMEPKKYFIGNIHGSKLPLSQIIETTEAATKGKVTRLSIDNNDRKPYELQVATSEEDKRGETYFVDPYQNKILGTGKGPASEFFMFAFKMHRWLLFDQEIGRPIVGAATLIFVILVLSGLFLWFPKKVKGWKSFKPGLKIKLDSKWKRLNHDLHNVLGFYTCIFVLIMALTGLCWSFEWYKDGMSGVLGSKVFGGRDEQKPKSEVVQDQKALQLENVFSIAATELNYKGKTSISLPKKPDEAFEISKTNPERSTVTATDKLFIDQYSGQIVKRDLFESKSAGSKIASQIKAIHTGEIFGTFSKVLYFIVCLIATSLPVTGVFIWINKLRKKDTKPRPIAQ